MRLKGHIFICGITGSGKTTFANYLFRNNNRPISIFINTQHENYFDDCLVVNSLNDFGLAFEQQIRHIVFNPSEQKNRMLFQVKSILQVLKRYGALVNKNRKKTRFWGAVFIDEIHEYSSKTKPSESIDFLWKRGRRYGIQACGITTRPAEVSHAILTQSNNHFIFKISPYEIPYFKKFKIGVEELQKHLEKPYHFIYYDNFKVYKMKPIRI